MRQCEATILQARTYPLMITSLAVFDDQHRREMCDERRTSVGDVEKPLLVKPSKITLRTSMSREPRDEMMDRPS